MSRRKFRVSVCRRLDGNDERHHEPSMRKMKVSVLLKIGLFTQCPSVLGVQHYQM
jgi:hypothetical protein